MEPEAGVTCEGFEEREAAALCGRAARRVLEALDCRRLAVELAAVDVEESARLNLRYRSRNRPAEVLSFPLPGREPGGNTGLVIVCPPMIRRRAHRLGMPFRRWLEELAVHGVLHALGFSHDDGQMPLIQRAMAGRR